MGGSFQSGQGQQPQGASPSPQPQQQGQPLPQLDPRAVQTFQGGFNNAGQNQWGNLMQFLSSFGGGK